jgi:CRISPR/Cas system-associated exonuclease Cas4 (RecB family)
MDISWSRLSSAGQCLRQYEMRYIEGLEKVPSVENEGRIFGSAIHAGFEAALRFLFARNYGNQSVDLGSGSAWITEATRAINFYISTQAVENKMIYNYDTQQKVMDYEYYTMLEEVRQEASAFIRYYLPRVGIGSKYVPVSVSDVLPNMQEAHIPVVEWEFRLPFDDHFLVGRIDAVMRDTENGELVMFDWKSRTAMPKDYMALLDGQLHLYAAVINEQGGSISRIAMAQMKRGIPKGAELSKKDNLPLTGRASYNMTWESFCASLPASVNPEFYREELAGKLKQFTPDFFNPIFGFVTDVSTQLALANVRAQIGQLEFALKSDVFPARLSSNACQFCEFSRLCAGAFRYGGDPSEMIERDFQKRDHVEIVEEALDTP